MSKKFTGLQSASLTLAIISFIPVCGVIFALVGIVLGVIDFFQTKQKKSLLYAGMGILGIIFSILICIGYIYISFFQSGGYVDKNLEEQVRNIQLPQVVDMLEAYKVDNEEYPVELSELSYETYDSYNIDPIQMRISLKNNDVEWGYYYEKRENGYYLFSEGFDAEPFTEDDIYPIFTEGEDRGGYLDPLIK